MFESEVRIITTVSASLRMFDMMTRPLQQVTQALNLTISAMDNLSNSANRDIKVTNSLNAAKAAAQRASAGLQELANEQNRTANNQERLNNSLIKGTSASDTLLAKIKGIAAAYLGIEATKQGIKSTIGGAMGLQQQLFTLQGIMGNKDVATVYFDNITKKANESVFSLEDFAGSARKFMQFTKNTKSLDKLLNLNERLTLMDPTQGFEGAGFAMKEAMSGDFVSLKERFGFGKADAEILKASKSMDDFISKFDTLLNKKGFTESMLQQYNKSATAQFDNLKSNIETALAQSGNNALNILAPVITKLNDAFSNGNFQGLFNGISVGIAGAVNLVLWLGNNIQWLWNVFSSSMPYMAPIIWGIVASLIAYNATMGIAWLTTLKDVAVKIAHTLASWAETAAIIAMTLAQQGLNAALAMCPITWIIIAIIILIAVFYVAVAAVNHFAGTSISATGIIAGVFAFLGAHIYNVVAYMWNVFAAYVEFLSNVFNNPVYSIKKLFANLAINVIDMCIAMTKGFDSFATNLANAMIDGINMALGAWNSFVDTLNSFGGIGAKLGLGKAGTIGHTSSITSSMEGAKANINSWVGEAPSGYASVPRLEMKSLGDSWNAGYNLGKGVEGKFDMSKILENSGIPNQNMPTPDLAAWNASKGPGELSMGGDTGKNKGANDANKHLKNIDDKMDVSNEHLEMLRDLAEMESVQNFVTLTPTVQVTTGDIKEEADINKIIKKIESYMENELANSAEGVYK